MKKTSHTSMARSIAALKAHKIATAIIAVTVLVGGYQMIRAAKTANAAPQYTLAMARTGSITQTVTGSGQISAENQLDVTSQASGAVQSISVKVGDHVEAGQLLATIDPHDAALTLENARIAYAKLVAPAKETDITTAENSVAKAYGDGFNAAASAFLDLPTVMSGLKGILYDQGGALSEANATRLNSTARPMREQAGIAFDAAAKQYAVVLQEYQSLSRSSAAASIDALIADTYTMLKAVSDAVQKTKNTINYIATNQPDYYSSLITAAASNAGSWAGTVNSDVSSLLSAQNGIASSNQSLSDLMNGPDALDIQSQQISLAQAEKTYSNYFVRAPFAGIVGRIPVSVYSQAGGSTVIATIIGDQKIASISLNEVDAAKVAVGQPVAITFDAIDGLTATGTVAQVDLVGTVSQGVVSYGVKIAVDTQDARIKPGMSVNVSITTKQRSGVLVVPSSAVKTLGGASYVQTLPASALPGRNGAAAGADRFASTTRQYSGAVAAFGTPSLTVSTKDAPQRMPVVIGDSDDTNTEIVSGLERGAFVITKTAAAGATAANGAPSILSSFGNRTGAAGTVRNPAGTVRFQSATPVKIGG